MAQKVALITGITGQDGSYLAEFLLEKGYQVNGTVQVVEMEDPVTHLWRIQHLMDDIHLYVASLESYPSLYRTIEQINPDECYHLAAKSFVSYSLDEFSTLNININGAHFVLSAIKEKAPDCKFYFAGTSEMFGLADHSPQNEQTPFNPRSLYGISKIAGYHLTNAFRQSQNLFACIGILYNHESERRSLEFLTRKVSSTVARIKLGLVKELRLGNLEARRDWGYAPEYVKAMWMMLQQPQPDDYVIATGQPHSVREFVKLAFEVVDLNWEEWVVIDKQHFRPSERYDLTGDTSKAHKKLGWKPEVSFENLVKIMVEADLRRLMESS
jgi:GDPmannose 4,6-dehydratase